MNKLSKHYSTKHQKWINLVKRSSYKNDLKENILKIIRLKEDKFFKNEMQKK